MVSGFTVMSLPDADSMEPSFTARTTRATAKSSSVMTASGSLRDTSRPSSV